MAVYMLSGPVGAGKTTIREYLEEDSTLIGSKYEVISLSDFLKKEKEYSTREDLGKIADELREQEGSDVLANKAIEYLENNTDFDQGNLDIIIDSIRLSEEVDSLRKYFQEKSIENRLLFVNADPDESMERIEGRHDKKDEMEDMREKIREDDEKFDFQEIRKMADGIIENTQLTKTEVENFLEGLIRSGEYWRSGEKRR